MKIDPYKHKERYETWKKEGAVFPGISKQNQKLLREYIFDMEKGINVNPSQKKGSRSFVRLNACRHKLKLITQFIENIFRIDITSLSKEQLHKIFNDMRNGRIKRRDGKIYLQTGDYAKIFKAFWHWRMRASKTPIEDITTDLDVSSEKPKWVYLKEKEFKILAEACKPDYKVMAYFLLDTGLRATEFINTRVSAFSDDRRLLNVPDEISKTVGRKVKLMISADLIKEYIHKKGLKGEDLLFTITPKRINEYFKRLATRTFGGEKTSGGKPYSELTLNDIRHISACYWLPRYPTQQGMMYRFGWKDADKIFYYSEFLGMTDNIQEEDMLIDVTKTELQHANDTLRKEFTLFKESSEHDIRNLKNQLEKRIRVDSIASEMFNDKRALKILDEKIEARISAYRSQEAAHHA